ncbi:MAG TPA: hypothetical protein VM325_12875 [Alphaproteobacteria bacterium]|nr:hypothetical protein [Alphaproteobacteria bacterium]
MIEDQDRRETDAEHMLKSVKQPCIERWICSVIHPAQFLGVIDFLGMIEDRGGKSEPLRQQNEQTVRSKADQVQPNEAAFDELRLIGRRDTGRPGRQGTHHSRSTASKERVRQKRRPSGRFSSRA